MGSESSSHWFWDWGYLVIAVAVLMVFWAMKSDHRENQDHVNPQVFEFFSKIENECRGESFENQSKRCVQVLDYQNDCKKFSAQCDSKAFFDLLKSLGFEVPMYYEEFYVPK